MWWPTRLACLVMIVASVLGLYYLVPTLLLMDNTAYGKTVVISVFYVLLITGLSGVGGIIASFGLKTDGQHFEPRENWYGKLMKKFTTPSFCLTSGITGLVFLTVSTMCTVIVLQVYAVVIEFDPPNMQVIVDTLTSGLAIVGVVVGIVGSPLVIMWVIHRTLRGKTFFDRVCPTQRKTEDVAI